jgi:hypothetical protein
VGINEVRRRAGLSANDNGPNLARAVYGSDHFEEEHSMQKFYKPKMLRQIVGHDIMLAYPDGLPGGWNQHRKIHIIAHSQGSVTSRYM